jgi:hypothetical protein
MGISIALAGIIFAPLGLARDTKYGVHRALGISAITLGGLQMSALFFRPPPGTKWRSAWSMGHVWLGRLSAMLAVATIYYALIHMNVVGTWAVIAYSGVLGVIACIGLGMDLTERTRANQKAKVSEAEMMSAGQTL